MRALLPLLLLLLPLAVSAEQSWYDVELILFQQPLMDSDEQLALPAPPPLEELVADFELHQGRLINPPSSVRKIPPQLSKKADILRDKGWLLLHTAWRLAFDEERDQYRIKLLHGTAIDSGYADISHPLVGYMLLQRRRYFHFETDLIYSQIQPLEDSSAWQFSPIVGKMRLRRQQLHYLDHPHIGLLLHIKRAAE